jgi:hypothetical protein
MPFAEIEHQTGQRWQCARASSYVDVLAFRGPASGLSPKATGATAQRNISRDATSTSLTRSRGMQSQLQARRVVVETTDFTPSRPMACGT